MKERYWSVLLKRYREREERKQKQSRRWIERQKRKLEENKSRSEGGAKNQSLK